MRPAQSRRRTEDARLIFESGQLYPIYPELRQAMFLIAGLFLLYRMAGTITAILLLFLLVCILAAVLNPIVTKLHTWHIQWMLGALVVGALLIARCMEQHKRWAFGSVVVGLIVGVVTALGLHVMGVSYEFLFGVTAATVVEIARLMIAHSISAVPVVGDRNQLLGIVTEHDLFLKEKSIPCAMQRMLTLFDQWAEPEQLPELYEATRHYTAADVMTQSATSVEGGSGLGTVARLMLERKLKRVHVVRDRQMAGIITRSDLVGLLARERL